jgi:hypothetical protein
MGCSLKLNITIMKKITLFMLGALLTAGAFAQTPATAASDKKEDMKDLRKDIRDVRKDKRELLDAKKDGDKTEVKEIRKDIKEDRKDIKADAKDLRADGVKHPVRRAKRQIRVHHRHH